jgi:histidinol phosphatase-like PHP family hydrolase
MALGLDPKRLRVQWQELDAWNARTRGFTILKGVELDILENGEVDLPDAVLAEADHVVVTVHYGSTQDTKALTHRLVGKRAPYALDVDALTRVRRPWWFVLSTDSHQPGNLPFMKYAWTWYCARDSKRGTSSTRARCRSSRRD